MEQKAHDGAPAPEHPAWGLTQDFLDADDIARALNGAAIEYTPLQAGPYPSRLTLLALGGTLVQRASDPPHVARGPIAPGNFALLSALAVEAQAEINGAPLDQGEALLMRPGFEMHALAPTRSDWISVMLPAAVVDPLLDLAGLGGSRRESSMLRLPAATVLPLQRLLRGMTDVVAEGLAPERAIAMAAGFGDHLAACFARATPIPAPPRRTRRALSILGMVEEFLAATRGKAVYMDDLVAATGAAPRSLHAAFLATTGLSPAVYLRRRRLMQVHAALKRGGPGRTLVKTVALDHGFWHLGHFAGAYAAMFGCSPQETLRRGRVAAADGLDLETQFSEPG